MTSTTKGPSAGFLSKDNKAEHGNSGGGIFLTERDVVRLRSDKIQNWPNPSELFVDFCVILLFYFNKTCHEKKNNQKSFSPVLHNKNEIKNINIDFC